MFARLILLQLKLLQFRYIVLYEVTCSQIMHGLCSFYTIHQNIFFVCFNPDFISVDAFSHTYVFAQDKASSWKVCCLKPGGNQLMVGLKKRILLPLGLYVTGHWPGSSMTPCNSCTLRRQACLWEPKVCVGSEEEVGQTDMSLTQTLALCESMFPLPPGF